MTVFLCTTENSGLDRHSQELAKLLPVNTVYTDRYRLGSHTDKLAEQLRAFDEVVHFTNQHFGRIALGVGLPFIVTVHDLERMCFPFAAEDPSARVDLNLDASAIKRADHIIAVSENTRRDLVKHLGVPTDRITVIHNGVDHSVFKPNGTGLLPFPYILYVGSERPRKNLETLLAAFAQLKKRPGFSDLKLVKVGGPGRSDAFRAATLQVIRKLGLEGEVVFVGQVTDSELSAYYSSARALVYPSLYEGFGLPILEAMACGCPVVTSNISSLPEVAGEAALFVNPRERQDLARAMARILSDGAVRRQLIAKGRERSGRFSWARAAEATAAVYRRVEASLGLPGAAGLGRGKD
ncbi:MAG: glycosyltransferase family 4 protein [Chloroflexi bacterium]|nr:glycosyltransferase family 4 protein [Chloroflexota bacterium]